MDLLALRSGSASFNPFTALIGLDTGAEPHELSLSVPVIDKPTAAHYSLLFHEVTHLWSMRTSLLGCVLSVAAARSWDTWSKHRSDAVDIEPATRRLLATWLPILEGLACYAELDYVADEDTDVIHSPVLKVAQFVSLSMNGMPNSRLFQIVRFHRLFEDELLRVLLLDSSRHQAEHAYLVGYLYVKAVAARLAHLCPRLARPATMLPLLIRTLCEHPTILDAVVSDMTVEGALAQLHRSILAIDRATLHRIADWIEDGDSGDVVARFDFLDVHESVNRNALAFLDDSMPWYDALGAAEVEVTLAKLRATGSIYLAEWDSGVLEQVADDAVILRQAADSKSYTLLTPAHFERLRPDRPLSEFANQWHHWLMEQLRGTVGRTLTAALYVDLASGDPGMAFWKDDAFLAVAPYSLGRLRLDDPERRDTLTSLGRGLGLPPTLRRQFGGAIRTPPAFSMAVARSSRWLIAQLVSSARVQERVIQAKLSAIDHGTHNTKLQAWAKPDLTDGLSEFPDTVGRRLDELFDRPGFPPDHCSHCFSQLMPPPG